MQAMDDMALLQEFATRNSEAAFETLVSRRVGFVYSAAMRQVRDPHLAGEVTQAVFIILAQKAGKIPSGAILSGWLFKTVRFAAMAQTRTAARRRHYEQEAIMEFENQCTAPGPLWEKISPMIDNALAQLGEKDRQAVLLRFFEGKSMAEVGNLLGTAEDTARMRIRRALEKLRRYFVKHGVSSTTAIIAEAIATNSIQGPPAALAKTAAAAALFGGNSALPLVKGALKIMAWTKAKIAVVAGVGLLIAAGVTSITVNEIHARDTSWWEVNRMSAFHWESIRTRPPQVRILPTKFPHDANGYWGRAGNGGGGDTMFVGIKHNLPRIIEIVYGLPDGGPIVYRTPVPEGDFDYIATLRRGSAKALQDEIKRKFGLAGRIENVETNALLLKVKNPNAPGLKRTDKSGSNHYSQDGMSISRTDMSNFAKHLAHLLKSPVIDQTGLTDSFAFDLKWDQDGGADAVRQVVLEQLGLELVPSVEPIEMLVVEKVK